MKSSNLWFKVGQCCVEKSEFLALQFGIKEFAFLPLSLLKVVDNDAVCPCRWEILMAMGTTST